MFAPEKGNVAFASAADGWAFRVGQFAALYAAKLGANPRALERAMWGDFAFQAKARRIVRIRPEQQGRAKPLFVQARRAPRAPLPRCPVLRGRQLTVLSCYPCSSRCCATGGARLTVCCCGPCDSWRWTRCGARTRRARPAPTRARSSSASCAGWA